MLLIICRVHFPNSDFFRFCNHCFMKYLTSQNKHTFDDAWKIYFVKIRHNYSGYILIIMYDLQLLNDDVQRGKLNAEDELMILKTSFSKYFSATDVSSGASFSAPTGSVSARSVGHHISWARGTAEAVRSARESARTDSALASACGSSHWTLAAVIGWGAELARRALAGSVATSQSGKASAGRWKI